MGELVRDTGRKGLAVGVLVIGAYVLFKVVIGAVAAVLWFAVVIAAVLAVVWALRVL